MESNLLDTGKRCDDLDNQLTAVTLQKDALEDEVGHVRKEMEEIRTQLDRVYADNGALNKQRYKKLNNR